MTQGRDWDHRDKQISIRNRKKGGRSPGSCRRRRRLGGTLLLSWWYSSNGGGSGGIGDLHHQHQYHLNHHSSIRHPSFAMTFPFSRCRRGCASEFSTTRTTTTTTAAATTTNITNHENPIGKNGHHDHHHHGDRQGRRLRINDLNYDSPDMDEQTVAIVQTIRSMVPVALERNPMESGGNDHGRCA
jgi:hypothetical protein